MDENEQLNERLQDSSGVSANKARSSDSQVQPTPSNTRTVQNTDLCQWQVGPGGTFRPAAKTIKSIEPGAYSCQHDDHGPFLRLQPLISDDIVRLPESANIRVLDGIRKFWDSRDRYTSHGLIFKRGVLLWGPPGSGKTVTTHLLTKDLIDRGGIVVFCGHPVLTLSLMAAIRRIERDRPLIVVMEDIDEIINQHGEHEILSMLDGENQTDNVVFIATTNYPERLGARIVNRPSRFDDRIFVGMPSEAARVAYLQKSADGKIDVEQWARDTEGLSIAHLRELVAAVLCLDQDYEDVLKRLRSMNERPKEVDGFTKRKAGFGLGLERGDAQAARAQ